MKPKLKIRGTQDVVSLVINQGDSITEDLFFGHASIKAILEDGNESKDMTRNLIKVNLSELEQLDHSGRFLVPWKIEHEGVLIHEGAIETNITVLEKHPTIRDYKIKNEDYQIIVHKGVAISPGSKKLPNLEWAIEYPGYVVKSFNVFFVNSDSNIMQVNYSTEFDYHFDDNTFIANYMGGLVRFDGFNRAGVAYILTLVEEDDGEEVDGDSSELTISSDSFTKKVVDESAVNQFLDRMVGKLSNLPTTVKSAPKELKDKAKVSIKNPEDSDTIKKKSLKTKEPRVEEKKNNKPKDKTPTKNSKSQNELHKKNRGARIILTIALTLLIGAGAIYGVGRYKDSALQSIQEDVALITSNQESAYEILSQETLSDHDISQLDKLLNQNQKMINALDGHNIFIAKERNRLAEYNNDLVSEAKIKFDTQIEQ